MTQAQALAILKTGANVFLTGEPGAGKTYVINEYVQYLRGHAIEPAITASTGIAATHIHGQTIHSWSGIGIHRMLTPYDLDRIATTEYIVRRIKHTAVLIIDEISMIDATTLDMVDQVCREVRQKAEAFGGIQVILVGDFFQLPPVSRVGDTVGFAFRSNAWRAMQPLVCYLSEQHRQSDEQFLSVLSAIRNNSFDVEHYEHLERRRVSHGDVVLNTESLTRLFPHNADVDTLNTREIKKITSAGKKYTMTSKGSASLVATLKKGCLSPEELELKIGASVMCTKNSKEKQFANGTLGTVVDFAGGTGYPIIQTRDGRYITIEPMEWSIEEDGKVKAFVTQIPLRLAWAITIHKSQGMSLDAALMDLSQVFEYGQGYVALSRVRTLDGLHLLGWNPQTFMVHPDIIETDTTFHAQSDAAEESFADIPADRLQKMHDNFITACGGDLKKKEVVQKKTAKAKRDTLEETRVLVLERKSLKDIGKLRNLVFVTIVGHLEKLVALGRLTADDVAYLFTPELMRSVAEIELVMKSLDTTFLGPVHEHFAGKYTYDQLRLAKVAILAKNQK